MIFSSDVCDPNSRNGSKFRLHFRVPYLLFSNFLVPVCSKGGKDVIQEHRKSVIPIKFEVLIALRVLARAHDSDTMSELSSSMDLLNYFYISLLRTYIGIDCIF